MIRGRITHHVRKGFKTRAGSVREIIPMVDGPLSLEGSPSHASACFLATVATTARSDYLQVLSSQFISLRAV